jgi:hypothetical protein
MAFPPYVALAVVDPSFAQATDARTYRSDPLAVWFHVGIDETLLNTTVELTVSYATAITEPWE